MQPQAQRQQQRGTDNRRVQTPGQGAPPRQADRRPPQQGQGRRGDVGQPQQPRREPHEQREVREPEPNRPMYRRDPDSKAAQNSRAAILALKPGQQVYVVPFGKRATLIRVLAEKDQAIVQSGIFEMQIPLADLEAVREPIEPPKKPKEKPATPAPKPPPPAAASDGPAPALAQGDGATEPPSPEASTPVPPEVPAVPFNPPDSDSPTP